MFGRSGAIRNRRYRSTAASSGCAGATTLGSYRLRSATQHGLVYERRHFDGAILIALNLTNEAQELLVPGRPAGSSTFDLSRRSRVSGWRSRSRRRC